jgi:hypothetical protein
MKKIWLPKKVSFIIDLRHRFCYMVCQPVEGIPLLRALVDLPEPELVVRPPSPIGFGPKSPPDVDQNQENNQNMNMMGLCVLAGNPISLNWQFAQ